MGSSPSEFGADPGFEPEAETKVVPEVGPDMAPDVFAEVEHTRGHIADDFGLGIEAHIEFALSYSAAPYFGAEYLRAASAYNFRVVYNFSGHTLAAQTLTAWAVEPAYDIDSDFGPDFGPGFGPDFGPDFECVGST